jgi:hypothetical protein
MKVVLLSLFCLSMVVAFVSIPVCAMTGASAQFMSELVTDVFGYLVLSALTITFIALAQPKEPV